MINGRITEVANAALDSSKEAVTLCIAMIGIMALWVGLMEIAKSSGLIRSITGKIRPFMHFMFPEVPLEHPAMEYMTMNVIANFLGLGWAATPAGLKAMEGLSALQEDRRNGKLPGTVQQKGVASNEMCVFLILNISSLQLIPVNIIAYRSQYGSVNPTAIVGPAIAATTISTVAAIIFCKIMDRKRRV